MAVVGIPGSLLYYRFFPLWEAFFGGLGVNIKTSKPSSNITLLNGANYAHSDSCLPIKLGFGHVAELMGDADYIFLPRFFRLEEKSFVCPKMIGFTDMIKSVLCSADSGQGVNCQANPACTGVSKKKIAGVKNTEFIEPLFDIHNYSNQKVFKKIGSFFSWNPFKIRRAYFDSVRHYNNVCNERENIFLKKLNLNRGLKIGVIGHPYNIYDEFISMGILKELSKLDVLPVTFEDAPGIGFECDFSKFPSNLFWSFGREIYKTAQYFMNGEDFKVDGIIYVAPFGCGLDSIMTTIVQGAAKDAGVPFLSLVVDEHTAKAGIVTRLEAFIDMIAYKK
ncbi:MAG: acyl-CoA dehydratase activase-related protein [Candidatus Wallbacteria bacterium]